jgi:hypothetical protein
MSFADLNVGRRNNWEQWNCETVGIAGLFGDCGNIFFSALATIGIDVGYVDVDGIYCKGYLWKSRGTF